MSSLTVKLYPSFDPDVWSGDEPELRTRQARMALPQPDLYPALSLGEWRQARGLSASTPTRVKRPAEYTEGWTKQT